MNQEELRNWIEQMRQKALRGEMTLDDAKAAVAYCREHRGKSAVRTPSASKPAAPKILNVSSKDLLKGL
jgi:hypothetical protein